MAYSYVEQSLEGSISGVLSKTTADERFIDIFADDLFLRRVPAHLMRDDIATDSNARGFRFQLDRYVMAMLPPGTILKARDTVGYSLAHSHTARIEPFGSASDGGAALRALLLQGSVIDKWGALKTPFAAQPENRRRYAKAMRLVTDYFAERHGVVAFPHYGTLLGHIREQKFIDHDDDVDLSIAIYDISLDRIIDRFFTLIHDTCADGHNVNVVNAGHFAISHKDLPLIPIDIFLSWGTDPLSFNTCFGVSGRLQYSLAFIAAELEDQKIRVPIQSEEILAMTYGPSWKLPDPTFIWQPSSEVNRVMQEMYDRASDRLKVLLEKIRADRSDQT